VPLPQVENRECPTCGNCGSSLRMRSLMYLLSMELFGRALTVPEFPVDKSVVGVGLSDWEQYSRWLERSFTYTNTFYHREPRLDITESHPGLEGTYDFILCADVLEHIAPPVERALDEMCRLLKPNGFAGITIFCHPSDILREHFPTLNQFRFVTLGDKMLLVNRRADGTLEVRDDLIFHGGTGSTLEMREYGVTALRDQLLAAGFQDTHLLTDPIPESGVVIDHDLSQPLIARKAPYTLSPETRKELVTQWRLNAEQIRLASASRWLKLGSALGVGPKFK